MFDFHCRSGLGMGRHVENVSVTITTLVQHSNFFQSGCLMQISSKKLIIINSFHYGGQGVEEVGAQPGPSHERPGPPLPSPPLSSFTSPPNSLISCCLFLLLFLFAPSRSFHFLILFATLLLGWVGGGGEGTNILNS